jgi:acyl carrier protein
MTKDQIFAVVKKHMLHTVDGLTPVAERDSLEGIALGKSMKNLGANSLDIVEVVSLSMREIKVKVPRSELTKLTDIGGLVDLLHTVSLEAGPA